MTDFLLLEKINQLNSSTVKPRLLHQKGAAAKGVFRPYMSFRDYTKAAFLQDQDEETPAIVRFSKMMGSMGQGDCMRDTRGFATRFFTREGYYDLICQNMPVYYINDVNKFPEMMKALLPSKENNLKDPRNYWRFLAANPGAINLTMQLYSNIGTIKSYRSMEGYSVNTFRWTSEGGDVLYVRYRWIPLYEGGNGYARAKGISDQEAEFLAGFEADYCTRDLYEAIEAGNFPVYELEIQVMEPWQLEEAEYDPLKTTLYWPEEAFPYQKVGALTLLEPFSAEDSEKLCFTPSNLPEGIAFADEDFLCIMDYAHKDGGRQRGGKW